MAQLENQVRTFIAIRLTPELCQNLAVFIEKFKNLPGNVRWLDPELMHLTLYFLGDVDAALIPKIMTACQVAVREVPPFKLDFVGSGVFPNFKQPRVVWAGVENGKKTLEKLHQLLGANLKTTGLKLEEETYTPHLTIGRAKFLKQIAPLKQMVEKTKTEVVGSLDVKKITLYKSVLTPKGPEYTIMGETHLKGD